METIFDYNLTKGELKRFNLTNQQSIEELKRLYSEDKDNVKCRDSNYYQLGLLFAMRNDDKKAAVYFDKIENRELLATLIEDF
jgi:hypothetical protein